MSTAIFFLVRFMGYPRLLAALDMAGPFRNAAVDGDVDQERAVGFECPADGRPDLRPSFDPGRGHAQGLSYAVKAKVGIAQLKGGGEFVLRHVALAPVLAEVVLEYPIASVVADHDLGADLVVRGR